MAESVITKIVRFTALERMRNTPDGNPKYRVFTDTGDTYVLADNAAAGFYTYHSGTRYEITVTARGQLLTAKNLDPEPFDQPETILNR